METINHDFTLEFCQDAFPLSTDSIALAAFAKLPKNARVLDLGSGCGTLGLLLCANHDSCEVTGVELDEKAHETALKNAEANMLSRRLTSICGDIRQLPSYIKPGSFQCCISNPPYFSGGPKSTRTPTARREDTCATEDLMTGAAWALKYGGDFFLVHRPERLGQLIACGAGHSLEVKRLCLLRHKKGGPVSLILLQFRKGAKPGLLWEECYLYEEDGSPSQYYRKLYHLQEE